MTKPIVFVTRKIPHSGIAMLADKCEVRVWEDELPPPRKTLLDEISEADGVLSLLTDTIDAEMMDAASRLKVISNFAVGYDNIDIAAATSRQIPVGHTPGVLTETTADFAFALLMAAARRISEAERYVRDGRWKTWGPTLMMGQDVHHATLGVIGFGRIGQAVARRAAGFDMRVVYYDQSTRADETDIEAEAMSLNNLLATSDFVSLHVPLTSDTKHLIDKKALQVMQPSSVLINTARGGVVDTDALYEALVSGEIAYAALDVTDPEPILADHPLLKLDNCLVVPHIASSSRVTRNRMAAMAAENLLAGLQDEQLPFCANPGVYEQ